MSQRYTIKDARRIVVRLARILGRDRVAVTADLLLPDDEDIKPASWNVVHRCWTLDNDVSAVLALNSWAGGYGIHVLDADSSGVRRVAFRGRTARELCEAVWSFEEGLRLYREVNPDRG